MVKPQSWPHHLEGKLCWITRIHPQITTQTHTLQFHLRIEKYICESEWITLIIDVTMSIQRHRTTTVCVYTQREVQAAVWLWVTVGEQPAGSPSPNPIKKQQVKAYVKTFSTLPHGEHEVTWPEALWIVTAVRVITLNVRSRQSCQSWVCFHTPLIIR